MSSLGTFDKSFGRELIGVDEAGRGPLAGPVVAAAVLFDEKILDDPIFKDVNDSKKLSPKRRKELYPYIVKNLNYGVGIVYSARIDEINILEATFEAMRLAIDDINFKGELVLVDGNFKIKGINNFEQLPVVKGDSKSFSIAAASIVAKEVRDEIMVKNDHIYPQYNRHLYQKYEMNQEILLVYYLSSKATTFLRVFPT